MSEFGSCQLYPSFTFNFIDQRFVAGPNVYMIAAEVVDSDDFYIKMLDDFLLWCLSLEELSSK